MQGRLAMKLTGLPQEVSGVGAGVVGQALETVEVTVTVTAEHCELVSLRFLVGCERRTAYLGRIWRRCR